MTCKKCGAKLNRDVKTCPACGAPAPKSRRGLWGTIFVILFVLIVSAVLIFFNLRGRDALPELSIDGLRGLFAREEAPSGELLPGEPDAAPVPEETETPEEEAAPVEEVPVEEAAPVEEAEQVEEAIPVEEAVQIEEAAPVEEASAAEETPAAVPEEAVAEASVGEPAVLDAAAYYREVETRSFSRLSEKLGAYGDTVSAAASAPLDRRVQLLCRLGLSETGRKLASSLLNMDMSWLESLSLSGDAALLDTLGAGTFSLSLNDSYVLGVELFSDDEAGTLLLRVPELSEERFALDRESIGYPDTSAETRALLAALPDGEQLDALLNRYLSLALRCLDRVERGSGVLEAEGVLQPCTVLSVEIDGETAGRLASTLVGELRWDDELEQIIRALASAVGEDADTRYAAFLSELDRLDYELARAEQTDDILRMQVYVDKNGEILGRSLRLQSDWQSFQFSCACPRDGERFGLEVRAFADDELLELAGRGVCAGDGGVSGSFMLRHNGETLSKMKLESRESGEETRALDLTLELGQRACEAVAAALPEKLRPYASELSVNLSLGGSEEELRLRAELCRAMESLCVLDVSELFSGGASVDVPEGEALSGEAWAASLDENSGSGIFANLREAGLPAALQLALRAYWKSLFVR